jgi:transcriptional regulator with XRE-family HTH domain
LRKPCGTLLTMAGNQAGNPAQHFGRQMRKERLSRGWSLPELAQITGINAGHLSRIETGKRPPSERLARACDAAFTERKGWFSEYYEESRAWTEVPAWFRPWQEYEDTAATLRVWSPGIVHGLLQTEAYARALISVQPAISDEIMASRLTARMERQRRVIMRDDLPTVWFVVDEMALYRRVGSPEIMAGQLRRLAEIAAMPHVTMQVLPAVEHPANASEFILADDAAWCEHVAGGYVFTDGKTVSSLAVRFDSLRAECYRASESAALINRTGELWAAGGSPLTATATAGPA